MHTITCPRIKQQQGKYKENGYINNFPWHFYFLFFRNGYSSEKDKG